jgi:hypothetical protein
VSNRPYQASLFGISKLDDEDTSDLKSSMSGLSWSSASSTDSLRREKLYQYRPNDLESISPGRTLWLQRRNSLSSQAAMYPPNLRYSSTGPLSTPTSLINRSPSSLLHHPPYSPSYQSASSASSRFGNFYGSLSSTRNPSTVSSVSRSTSSTSTKKSPLSTMRRASEPDVPVIPAQFLDGNTRPQLPRSPTLPCSWSPSLTHAPLSADPAIRAFSVNREISHDRSPMGNIQAPQAGSVSCSRFVEPSLDLDLSLRTTSVPPELPVRARGHSISSTVIGRNLSSGTAPVPTATYSTCPRISATPAPSTLSSLHVPRTRPPLTSNPGYSNSASTVTRPALSHTPSSTYSDRTISSTLSSEFATHRVLESERIKRRWEMARSREATAYGMGGWGSIQEDNGPVLGMRKARGRDKERKRACTAS